MMNYLDTIIAKCVSAFFKRWLLEEMLLPTATIGDQKLSQA
ncbi:hypothetical protein [Nostoc mirabile]|nr:hypothetical protein [Nostoc mirabile]